MIVAFCILHLAFCCIFDCCDYCDCCRLLRDSEKQLHSARIEKEDLSRSFTIVMNHDIDDDGEDDGEDDDDHNDGKKPAQVLLLYPSTVKLFL